MSYSALDVEANRPVLVFLPASAARPPVAARPLGERIDRTIGIVAARFDVSTKEIRSRARTERIARARQACCDLIMRACGTNADETGKALGIDRSTVSYNLSRVADRLETEKSFWEAYHLAAQDLGLSK